MSVLLQGLPLVLACVLDGRHVVLLTHHRRSDVSKGARVDCVVSGPGHHHTLHDIQTRGKTRLRVTKSTHVFGTMQLGLCSSPEI